MLIFDLDHPLLNALQHLCFTGMPIPRRDPDDDVLSMSARSVASSCSLASDTYERAKRRTEEFWGKNGIATR